MKHEIKGSFKVNKSHTYSSPVVNCERSYVGLQAATILCINLHAKQAREIGRQFAPFDRGPFLSTRQV